MALKGIQKVRNHSRHQTENITYNHTKPHRKTLQTQEGCFANALYAELLRHTQNRQYPAPQST